MRKYIMMIGAMVIAVSIHADVLRTVDFETEGLGYTQSIVFVQNTNNPSSVDYFNRVQEGMYDNSVPDYGNKSGTDWFFAAEDVDGLGEQYVTLTNINISAGYTSFLTTISLASDSDQNSFLATDYIHLEYSIDGGAYTTFGSYHGGVEGGAANAVSDLTVDADLNGVADPGGTAITWDFATHTNTFAGSGSTLDVRVAVYVGSNDEIAFDDITVTGTIPEPATVLLMVGATGGFYIFRRLKINGRLG